MQGSADGEDAPVATLQKQRPEAKQKENRRPEAGVQGSGSLARQTP